MDTARKGGHGPSAVQALIVPSHLPLAQRKVLCTRLVGLRALRPMHSVFLQAGAEDQFKAIEQRILSESSRALTDSPNCENLDRFLGDVLRDITSMVQPNLGKGTSKVFSIFLTELNARAGRVKCKNCRPAICDGGSLDDETVYQSGYCISEISDIFEEARNITIEYYKRFSTFYSQSQVPIVVLASSYCTEKPHRFDVDYFVSGATRYIDQGFAFISEVRFRLYPKIFDWESYLALFYVFLHECLSHVFQSAATKTKLRETTEPSDPFAEGWMDWITLRVLSELRNPPSWISVNSFSKDFGQHKVATHFHEARLDLKKPDRSEYSPNWRVGQEAAIKLFDVLVGLHPTTTDAWATFLRFSFDFNLLPFKSRDRESFAWHIDRFFPIPGSIFPVDSYSAIISAVRNYLETNDIYTFVAFVTGLTLH